MKRSQYLLMYFGFCLLLGSCKQPTPLANSDLNLNDYQKSVLNNLYVNTDEIYNRVEMYFTQYGIPNFDNGKVTVYEKNTGKYSLSFSLLLKDSLLVNFGRPNLKNPILYDKNGNILRVQKMNITYEKNKIKTSDNGASNWEFEHDGNCIIRRYLSKTSNFLETKKFCYDQDRRLILFEWYNNIDSTSTFEYFKYDQGLLIEKIYLKTKDLDTIIDNRILTESIENGLIKKHQTEIYQVIAKRDTFQVTTPYENEYYLIKKTPLTILKKVYNLEELNEEIIFTFNKNGHLIDYYV